MNPSWSGVAPAIHVFFLAGSEDVDARHKAGHDAVYHGGSMSAESFDALRSRTKM